MAASLPAPPARSPTVPPIGATVLPHRHTRTEDGRSLPLLAWALPRPWLVCSSATVGGGLGPREWVLNAQVGPGYARTDLAAHVAELAAVAGAARGSVGVGLLTAADVDDAVSCSDGGVSATVTAGVRIPTWASLPEGEHDVDLVERGPVRASGPGTINVVSWLPGPVTEGALVNLVATATEAKVQALVELGVPGTGTATDAVCVGCPLPARGDDRDAFGGPRSTWGGRLARAVHAATLDATRRSLARIDAERSAR